MGTRRREYEPRHQSPDGRRRHCWIVGVAPAPGPWAGLILEWRRKPSGGWVARVVYVPFGEQDGSSREGWFDSERLRPVVDPPPEGSANPARRLRR